MSTAAPTTVTSEELLGAVAALVDRAPSLDALRAHRLQLLAAAIWRERGLAIPPELRADERWAACNALAAPPALERACAACEGPLLLMKGPEVAAAYPRPGTRLFADLDLLVPDPEAVQRSLLAAGFRELEFPDGWRERHHLTPLEWPGMTLLIEVHAAPKLPPFLPAIDPGELFAAAVPSRTGVAGLLAPEPSAHAVLLAAHAWAHRPLGRLADLLDIAALLSQGADRVRAGEIARRWGWLRMWELTLSALDCVLYDAPAPVALRTWARYVREARDLSVLEYQLLRLAGPVVASGRRAACRTAVRTVGQAITPWPGGTWREKLPRTRLALADAFAPKALHDRRLARQPWQR